MPKTVDKKFKGTTTYTITMTHTDTFSSAEEAKEWFETMAGDDEWYEYAPTIVVTVEEV